MQDAAVNINIAICTPYLHVSRTSTPDQSPLVQRGEDIADDWLRNRKRLSRQGCVMKRAIAITCAP